MRVSNTAQRLKQIMEDKRMKQVDIITACKPYCDKYNIKLAKNDLSQYISGKVEPKQDKLTMLSLGLNVNEVWLMGYDVAPDMNALTSSTSILDQLEQAHGQDVRKVTEDYITLDTEDRAEIRGEIKHMLKADKYNENENKKEAI